MIRRLTILLLIVGCDEFAPKDHTHTDTGTTVTDTLFVYDTLIVINYDTLIINNYDTIIILHYDTTIVYDTLIVLDTLVIEQVDCNGVQGGAAIELSCGICSDFNSQNFSEITNFNFSILDSVCDYDSQYRSTNEELLKNIDSAFIFIEGSENNRILISIPHAQKSFRYTVDDPNTVDDEHLSEVYTGAYGKILSEITGAALITSKYKSDDANWYDSIPSHTQTPAFENMIGQKLPYKAKLDTLLNQDLSNIFLIIDIHGKSSSAFQSRWAIDVGVGDSLQSLTTEIGKCIPDIFSSIFLKYGFNSTYNSIHYGYGSQKTITTYVTKEINQNLDAMQLEINREFRGCEGDEWEDYYNMIMALSEFINTMNYIYNFEIISQ